MARIGGFGPNVPLMQSAGAGGSGGTGPVASPPPAAGAAPVSPVVARDAAISSALTFVEELWAPKTKYSVEGKTTTRRGVITKDDKGTDARQDYWFYPLLGKVLVATMISPPRAIKNELKALGAAQNAEQFRAAIDNLNIKVASKRLGAGFEMTGDRIKRAAIMSDPVFFKKAIANCLDNIFMGVNVVANEEQLVSLLTSKHRSGKKAAGAIADAKAAAFAMMSAGKTTGQAAQSIIDTTLPKKDDKGQDVKKDGVVQTYKPFQLTVSAPVDADEAKTASDKAIADAKDADTIGGPSGYTVGVWKLALKIAELKLQLAGEDTDSASIRAEAVKILTNDGKFTADHYRNSPSAFQQRLDSMLVDLTVENGKKKYVKDAIDESNPFFASLKLGYTTGSNGETKLNADGSSNNELESGHSLFVAYTQVKSKSPGWNLHLDGALIVGGANAQMGVKPHSFGLGIAGPRTDTQSASTVNYLLFNINGGYEWKNPGYSFKLKAGLISNDSREFAGSDGIGSAEYGQVKFNLIYLNAIAPQLYFEKNFGSDIYLYSALMVGGGVDGLAIGNKGAGLTTLDNKDKTQTMVSDMVLGVKYAPEKKSSAAFQLHLAHAQEKWMGGLYGNASLKLSDDSSIGFTARAEVKEETVDLMAGARGETKLWDHKVGLGVAASSRSTSVVVGQANTGPDISGSGALGSISYPLSGHIYQAYVDVKVTSGCSLVALFAHTNQINGESSLTEGNPENSAMGLVKCGMGNSKGN